MDAAGAHSLGSHIPSTRRIPGSSRRYRGVESRGRRRSGSRTTDRECSPSGVAVASAAAVVNVTTRRPSKARSIRIDPRLAPVAVPRHTRLMDASLLLAGAAGIGGYGYLRPTEVFRHVVGARLRVAGFRSQRLELPRARVRVWRGGRGDPLVFVHGFGTEASVNWSQQLPAARRRFAVIAPDLPGFGASDRVGDERTIAFQVDCLHDLVTRLGCERV